MTFKNFMDLYDNWNGTLVINDNNLNPIIKGNVSDIMDSKQNLFEKEVIAFGFYDNELTVRIK